MKKKLDPEIKSGSEKKYKALFRIAPIGISITDKNRAILESNNALAKVSKISDSDFKKGLHTKRKYYLPDGTECPEIEIPSYKAINENRPVLNVELSFKDENNSVNWLEVSAAPIEFSERCAVVITQNITERKNLELRLRASEEKYRTFFENSFDAILITSQDGAIHAANVAACNMLGYDEETICRLGRNGIVEPTKSLEKALFQRKETGKYFGELVFIKKDGTRFPVEISSSVFTNSDGRQLTTIIIRDISERKKTEKALLESEERLRLASKAAGFGTYSYDFKTGTAYYSDEFLALYGLKSGSILELDRDLLAKALHPDDKPLFLKALKYANQPAGSGILNAEFRIILPDGKIRWLKVRGLTTFSGKSKIDKSLHANGIVQDITQRRNSSELLELVNKHLIEVRENERSQIALNLHDDLGQRLTALFLDVSWLKGRIGNSSGAVKERVDGVLRAINETIDSLKEISSFLRPTLLYDLGLVPAVISQLNKFEKQSGIKCCFLYDSEELDIDEDISLILYRIIQESLTNIARHSMASLMELKLKKLKNKIKMVIKDDGIGVDNDKLDSVMSLGIEGIRERVRSANGEVAIKGKKGKGTIIIVTIPLKLKDS